jgi:ribosomal protein S18 acetylase RimI-like enzyme
MESASSFLVDRGCHFVELNVFGPNDRARGLYESMGYISTEEMRMVDQL